MAEIQERKKIINGTEVFYIGVSHWMGEVIRDKLLEIEPDVICAEAPPDRGFTNRMDQKTVQSHLSMRGTPIVMMDSSNRLTKQEFIDKFGEETLKQVNKASGREEIRRIDRELYRLLIENREKNAMIPRIRECAKSQSGGKIAVVVGSEHLDGLV